MKYCIRSNFIKPSRPLLKKIAYSTVNSEYMFYNIQIIHGLEYFNKEFISN